MKLKRIEIYLLTLSIFSLVFPLKAHAHIANLSPFLSINGKLTGNNLHFYKTEALVIPMDVAPESYLKNQNLEFKIDISKIESDQASAEARFRWSFDPNSKDFPEGTNVKHTYTEAGTYFVKLEMKTPNDQEFKTFNTIQLNVLPDKNYRLPNIRIGTLGSDYKNGKPITFIPLIKPGTSSVKTLLWDLGDNQTSQEREVTKTFSNIKDPKFIYLRAIDSQGLVGDNLIDVSTEGNKVSFNRTYSVDAAFLPVFQRPKAKNNFLPLIIAIGMLGVGGVVFFKFLKKSRA